MLIRKCDSCGVPVELPEKEGRPARAVDVPVGGAREVHLIIATTPELDNCSECLDTAIERIGEARPPISCRAEVKVYRED